MDQYSVVIIGSGAAGYSVADWLYKYGIKNIAVLTENKYGGTSRNAGSDKQTYYKTSCTEEDSAEKMAKDLFCGGCMHGDTAYIEAANSLRCFMRLVEYGVPFPTDKLGRYIGYKTDHDSASRGTSAGPLTSKYMTECLEKQVEKHPEIHIIDGATVIKIVKKNDCAVGLIYLKNSENGYKFVPVSAKYIVIATGGAANIYKHSVYPVSQTGAIGLAIDAGCRLSNFSEWQYGIASTQIRWNLSGSYQQVIPAYYSVDDEGKKYDFLSEVFSSSIDICNNIFLKGYQWPFDSRKANASSAIDLAVSDETKKGRKVFLDFRKNPADYNFDLLCEEAKNYLINAGASHGNTPFERLQKLNPKAIEFYKSKGIDLADTPLEIAVCAQHMNGGIDVDCNWMTSVKNLFAAGEAAGTFGLYRPGGSALNSTQVSGLRIAQYIASDKTQVDIDENIFSMQISDIERFIENCLDESAAEQKDFSEAMSLCAAHCRVDKDIARLYKELCAYSRTSGFKIPEKSFSEIRKVFKYRDNLLAQLYLCRTLHYALPLTGGRGGAVYYKDNQLISENKEFRSKSIITDGDKVFFEEVRSIPNSDYNFEQEWHRFNQINRG